MDVATVLTSGAVGAIISAVIVQGGNALNRRADDDRWDEQVKRDEARWYALGERESANRLRDEQREAYFEMVVVMDTLMTATHLVVEVSLDAQDGKRPPLNENDDLFKQMSDAQAESMLVAAKLEIIGSTDVMNKLNELRLEVTEYGALRDRENVTQLAAAESLETVLRLKRELVTACRVDLGVEGRYINPRDEQQ